MAWKVDFAIADGTESTGALDPREVAAVGTGAGVRVKFCILHVEGFDAFVVQVDVAEVVHALQDEVRRIVEHVGTLVAAYFVEESLEGGSVVEVFSRVDFIGEIDATFVKVIEGVASIYGPILQRPPPPIPPGAAATGRNTAKRMRLKTSGVR
jgi:hypothetical protein